MFHFKKFTFEDRASLTSYNGTIRLESARTVLPRSPYLKYPIQQHKGSDGRTVMHIIKLNLFPVLVPVN